ncbi:hypothetical protein FQR65_LT12269 [Abscondita terminalis]|nr:hypothetical protein FQR65_LT12269 [Abscondita terminalis]
MMVSRLLLLIATCLGSTLGGKLPSDIKVCRRSDPKLSECFKDAIQDALPKLRNGVPEIDFSPIEPYEIKSLTIDAGSDSMKVVQNYKNMKIYELSNSIIEAASLFHDGDNFYAVLEVLIPITRGEGDYSIDGNLMMLPIKGEGKCSIVFKDSKVALKMNGTKFESGGESFLRINEFHVNFEPALAEFKFDNLFNNDKKLGEAMNTLINQSWRDLFEEVKDPYEQTFADLFKDTTNAIFTKIPVEELFPQ